MDIGIMLAFFYPPIMEIELQISNGAAHGTGVTMRRDTGRVAYLLAADIVSRLPSCRLSDDHQPVIIPPNRFSTPRPSLFSPLYAHPSRSIPRSSTGILL